MSEYETTISAEVEVCGDPNCIACRCEIIKTFTLGLLGEVDRDETFSIDKEAGLNLLLAAAMAFRDDDDDVSLREFISAAESSFSAEISLAAMRRLREQSEAEDGSTVH